MTSISLASCKNLQTEAIDICTNCFISKIENPPRERFLCVEPARNRSEISHCTLNMGNRLGIYAVAHVSCGPLSSGIRRNRPVNDDHASY